MRSSWRRLASSIALFAALPIQIGATGLATNLPGRILALHNAERAAYGIAPLVWHDDLAAAAQRWADHLAATHGFVHAAEDPRSPQGENLWRGTHAAFPVEAMVADWSDEKRAFKPGVFPDNSTTGRVADVGHFTQMIWRKTNAVGCAIAVDRGDDVLVCRYSDAGNYEGERPF